MCSEAIFLPLPIFAAFFHSCGRECCPLHHLGKNVHQIGEQSFAPLHLIRSVAERLKLSTKSVRIHGMEALNTFLRKSIRPCLAECHPIFRAGYKASNGK